MEKARLKDHLKQGQAHYHDFLTTLKKFMQRWNDQYNSKVDQTFVDEFKRVANYHGWFLFDDLKFFLELGIMGELGEYKGINVQTINLWFNAFKKRRQKAFKDQTHFQTDMKPLNLSAADKMENRRLTLQQHEKHMDEYRRTGQRPKDFNHYMMIYAKIYRKCGWLSVSDREMETLTRNYLSRISDHHIFEKKSNNNETNISSEVYGIFKKVANGNLEFTTMKNV